MPFSFRQIQYFIATADAGKVSGAAANLNVSQSAITAAVKALEDLLGRHLFDRHSNGVTLTYDGHQFLQHARGIVAAVSEATRAPRRSGASIKGEIAVGVTYTVAGYFLPPLLARFWRMFPAVKIHLHELDREEIEHGLISGSLDLAVMLVSNLQRRDEIVSDILIRSKRRLWVSAGHELLRKEKVELADIARYPYLMLTVDEAEKSALRYWAGTNHSPNVIFRTLSVEAIRSMVASGMGVTILSDMVYRPWSLEGQRIDVRDIEGQVHSMDVGLVWPRSSERSEAGRAFCDLLSMAFTSTMPHYSG
jgi:DNA-binding transcriptional LysR family regulator